AGERRHHGCPATDTAVRVGRAGTVEGARQVGQSELNAAVGGTSTVPPAARKCDWILAVVSTEGQTAALTIEPARPWPFSLWSKFVIRFPVVMSWASRFARAPGRGCWQGCRPAAHWRNSR
ncbi:MAG TPA: hypothetical protein VIJ23_13730, partial [Mycobacterium sp.]